ncbi:MAG: acyl-CoA thioesterase [Myxococcota bacterium]
MSGSAHSASITLRVPFYDCDPLFVVWHGRYFQYLEQARTELFASCGLDVPDVRDLGYRMYISEVRCRYTYPLTYGDEARITARFTDRTPLVKVAYDVTNVTKGRKSARAYTAIATTDAAGALLPETPHAILARIPA